MTQSTPHSRIAQIELSSTMLNPRQLIEQSKQQVMIRAFMGVAEELELPTHITQKALQGIMTDLHKVVNIINLIDEGADLETIREQVNAIYADKSIDRFEQQLRSLNDNSGRIQRLIGSLHKFSRVSERLEAIHLNRTIEDLLQLTPALTVGKIDLIKQYADLPAIEGYASAIQQLVFTLIDFSISRLHQQQQDIRQDGNGRPVLRGKLSIRTNRCADQVELHLVDNGPSIPKIDCCPRFEPMQADSPLSMSQQLIRLHQGSLECFNRSEQGVELLVRLPLRQTA